MRRRAQNVSSRRRPSPSRMDGEIVTRLVDMIKAKVPQADQRDPLSVLDEVMSIIGEALGERYGAEEAV
jgi:hypothetical protein